MSRLNDDLVLDILSFLSALDLAILTPVSKAMYVFSQHSELWQPLVVEEFQGDFQFTGNWKGTFTQCIQAKRGVPIVPHVPLSVPCFFSDRLFQPWHCASSSWPASWFRGETIPREKGLSLEDFIEKYESRNLPVILSDVVPSWPAYGKWSREWLLQHYGSTKFAAGPVHMTLKDYYAYHDAARGTEERPFYLFDKHFSRSCPELLADYTPPDFTKEDLFQLLGADRPDFRWLIIGPRGSGSSFHIDPNSTSAWNGVITGRKRWIMFPPHLTPPGVHPSGDKAEVATPVSIKEWYLNFYSAFKRDFPPGSGPVEGTCEAGELVFVPNGWWHLVWNLEDSIALTQNFVSRQNVRNVLAFLQYKPSQISGLHTRNKEGVYQRFRAALEQSCPGLDLTEEAREEAVPWSSLTQQPQEGSFSFGFQL